MSKFIASFNGLAATEAAKNHLSGGMRLLDACVAGVRLVEDDPDEHTVGYGGLPDENGLVTLDAAVMDGRTHRGGSIIGLRNVRHVSSVALRLMQLSRRVALHGEGAFQFAMQEGFPQEDLLTDKARKLWRLWKRKYQAGSEWQTFDHSEEDAELLKILKRLYRQPGGTVHCAGIDSRNDLACVTSTSGHCFRTPGRVGDSPMLGAGLYVDNEVGTCGSIGHGEANLLNCTSFLAVEFMRQGQSPRDAGLNALQRIAQHTASLEQDELGRPTFNVQLFLLGKDGSHAGVSIYGDWKIAVTDDAGSRLESCDALYPAS